MNFKRKIYHIARAFVCFELSCDSFLYQVNNTNIVTKMTFWVVALIISYGTVDTSQGKLAALVHSFRTNMLI